MKKVELLLPAGNIEKLDYAINYGADAVYMGMVDFSLRSMRKGEIITEDNLKKAVELAHSYGKKVYMTLNIYRSQLKKENNYEKFVSLFRNLKKKCWPLFFLFLCQQLKFRTRKLSANTA